MGKKSKKNTLYTIILLVLIGIATLAAELITTSEEQAVPTTVAAAALVEPTPASAESQLPYELPRVINNQPEQVIQHLGYTVSYNPDWLVPNWVAYELTNAETSGEQERKNHFKPDPLVNGDPVVTGDYANSGYDRGHMAPAADMKWSKDAMRDCFYLTNICPQNQKLNREAWQALEEKTRAWAVRDGKLIVIVGPIVSNHPQRLASGIAIPEGFFKVLLATNVEPMRAIAFIYKNQSGQKNMSQQAVSIDSVEEITGLDFFSSLPDEKETPLEKSCNFNAWNN